MNKNRIPAFTQITEATESEIQAVLSQGRAKSEFVLRMDTTQSGSGFKIQGDFGRIYQRVAAYNSKHKEKHFRCMQHPVNKNIFVIRDR
jgi:hypothetical protein